MGPPFMDQNDRLSWITYMDPMGIAGVCNGCPLVAVLNKNFITSTSPPQYNPIPSMGLVYLPTLI